MLSLYQINLQPKNAVEVFSIHLKTFQMCFLSLLTIVIYDRPSVCCDSLSPLTGASSVASIGTSSGELTASCNMDNRVNLVA